MKIAQTVPAVNCATCCKSMLLWWEKIPFWMEYNFEYMRGIYKLDTSFYLACYSHLDMASLWSFQGRKSIFPHSWETRYASCTLRLVNFSGYWLGPELWHCMWSITDVLTGMGLLRAIWAFVFYLGSGETHWPCLQHQEIRPSGVQL